MTTTPETTTDPFKGTVRLEMEAFWADAQDIAREVEGSARMRVWLAPGWDILIDAGETELSFYDEGVYVLYLSGSTHGNRFIPYTSVQLLEFWA